jgi:L-cystine transport system ATP-binding protein
MLTLQNVHKQFGTNQVLKGVSVHVPPGKVVVLIGSSGSGKTTLLRCVNFLEQADRGTLTIGGDTVDFERATKKERVTMRKKTGMVFQSYNLFNNKTALENIMEGLIYAKKIPKVQARELARELLVKVGLPEKADAYPKELSGGQAQRVGIARALALNPKIILLDEPTSALDPELVGEVLNVVKTMADEGQTMLVVTHEMSFAREIASEVIFMDAGVVVESGPPREFFGNPRMPRTREFLQRTIYNWGREL